MDSINSSNGNGSSTVAVPMLSKVAMASGMAMGGLATLHLANTISAAFSVSWYDRVQQSFLRPLYQNRVAETLLLGAVGVHVGAAVVKKVLRVAEALEPDSSVELDANDGLQHSNHSSGGLAFVRRLVAAVVHAILPPAGAPLSQQLFQVAGAALAVLLPTHVNAVRVVYHGVVANMSDVLRYSLNDWVMFYPYYLVLGCAGVVHVAFGAHKAYRGLVRPARDLTQWRRESKVIVPLVAASGVAGMVMAVVAFGRYPGTTSSQLILKNVTNPTLLNVKRYLSS